MLVKAVAPVLLVLAALATPASADGWISIGVSRCHRVFVDDETLNYPGFTVCRALQQ